MSTTTDHYNLVLPTGDELYSIDTVNSNNSNIDTAMYGLEQNIVTLATRTGVSADPSIVFDKDNLQTQITNLTNSTTSTNSGSLQTQITNLTNNTTGNNDNSLQKQITALSTSINLNQQNILTVNQKLGGMDYGKVIEILTTQVSSFYFYNPTTASTTYVIDWGDGITETFALSATTSATHYYSFYQQYVIKIYCNKLIDVNNSKFIDSTSKYNSIKFFDNIKSFSVTFLNLRNYIQEFYIYSKNIVTIPNGLVGSNLISYSNTILKTLYLSDSIMSIGDNAFGNLKALRNIKLPIHLLSLGKQAFWNITNGLENTTATYLSLPKTLQSVGEYCFYGSTYLTLKYEGDSTAWNLISKGSNWDDGMNNSTPWYNQVYENVDMDVKNDQYSLSSQLSSEIIKTNLLENLLLSLINMQTLNYGAKINITTSELTDIVLPILSADCTLGIIDWGDKQETYNPYNPMTHIYTNKESHIITIYCNAQSIVTSYPTFLTSVELVLTPLDNVTNSDSGEGGT